MNSPFPFTSRTLLLNVSFSSHILRISLFTFDRSRPLYSGNRFPIVSNSYCYWNCLKNSDKDNKIICYFLCLESISVHFLLASRICYFLCLETKKVTKENSRLQSRVLGIGATVFQLAHAIQLAPPRTSVSLKQYCLLNATTASFKTIAISQNSLRPFEIQKFTEYICIPGSPSRHDLKYLAII